MQYIDRIGMINQSDLHFSVLKVQGNVKGAVNRKWVLECVCM